MNQPHSTPLLNSAPNAARLLERRPVDLFVSDLMADLMGERDKALGGVRGDGLPALVVADVSLGATHALSQSGLGQAEAVANGFDGVHGSESSATASDCQQRHCFELSGATTTVRGVKSNRADHEKKRAKVTDEHREEAARLTALWLAANNARKLKNEEELKQADFGHDYGIGGQSAVGQFLRGDAPLSLKAATGFAKGLGCRISDFSPRLARKAASLREAEPGRAALSLVDLNYEEGQLVLLFRGLNEQQRAELLSKANTLYAETHPEASVANPFPRAKLATSN